MKCAKCGKDLNGGGLIAAFVGRVCWGCYHEGPTAHPPGKLRRSESKNSTGWFD